MRLLLELPNIKENVIKERIIKEISIMALKDPDGNYYYLSIKKIIFDIIFICII